MVTMNKIFKFKQTHVSMLEAGGLLLGRHIKNEPAYIVDCISTPMWSDKATRHTFYRGKGHQRFLKKYWKKTNGTGQFIGLWHTHPEPIPTPSCKDYDDWGKQLTSGTFLGDRLFFCIVGQKTTNVWMGLRDTMQFQKMENRR